MPKYEQQFISLTQQLGGDTAAASLLQSGAAVASGADDDYENESRYV